MPEMKIVVQTTSISYSTSEVETLTSGSINAIMDCHTIPGEVKSALYQTLEKLIGEGMNSVVETLIKSGFGELVAVIMNIIKNAT